MRWNVAIFTNMLNTVIQLEQLLHEKLRYLKQLTVFPATYRLM